MKVTGVSVCRQEFLMDIDIRGDTPDNKFQDLLYDKSCEIEPKKEPFPKKVVNIRRVY